ncbi:GNAT family N-acetyltransferase [Kibdelosporangium persicum]|uniref:N-acetyltransferase n=1 Tax=Kibdelosporangium persicum TaxID=2698649 RepID=A0ABX2FJL4_9PSEU|nr:GNAT family N-acetyltransferase [Kibdelosporangium persicum]NRN70981.1 N-acetyltransferase [Kibdelosporangium persicum]
MSDVVIARSSTGVRKWRWHTELGSYGEDVTTMVTRSAEDEGILGFHEPLTTAEKATFCGDLEHKLLSGSDCLLLGSDDDGVVGMCIVSLTAMPNCRHIADVSKAYLEPRVRRTTAISEIAWAVCGLTRELGVETLKIDVREDSPAHRVWRRFGFTTYGILDDYSRVDGVSHRGHFMSHSVERLAEFIDERLRRAGVVMEQRRLDDVAFA